MANIGSLKGCCRQKVVGFWRGTFNPPKSLNKFIVVSARILFFEGVAEDAAIELLTKYVRELPVDARDCSQRLLDEDWSSIDATIRSDVAKAYSDNAGQKDIDNSTDKLRTSVACWQKIGFRLSDKTTWSRNARRPEGNLDVEWSDEDRKNITNYLGPALGKKYAHLACDVAEGIVKSVAKIARFRKWDRLRLLGGFSQRPVWHCLWQQEQNCTHHPSLRSPWVNRGALQGYLGPTPGICDDLPPWRACLQ